MKKLIFVLILTIILVYTMTISAKQYEGEVIKVNLEENTMVLREVTGKQIMLQLREDACLYYNKGRADLGMYCPVTEDDFVSGSVETDQDGLVREASFFYLFREGTFKGFENGKLLLRDVHSGICDDFLMRSEVIVYLNNYVVNQEILQNGMQLLVVLDHRYQVKKIAAFYYDYSGFIQNIDLDKQTIVINVGSRLQPEFREFVIGEEVVELHNKWESILQKLENNSMIFAKVMVSKDHKRITFLDVRPL